MKQVKLMIAWIVTIPYVVLILACTWIATFIITINLLDVRCIDRWCVTEHMRLAYMYYKYVNWIAQFTDNENSDSFAKTKQTMLDIMDECERRLALLD